MILCVNLRWVGLIGVIGPVVSMSLSASQWCVMLHPNVKFQHVKIVLVMIVPLPPENPWLPDFPTYNLQKEKKVVTKKIIKKWIELLIFCVVTQGDLLRIDKHNRQYNKIFNSISYSNFLNLRYFLDSYFSKFIHSSNTQKCPQTRIIAANKSIDASTGTANKTETLVMDFCKKKFHR